MYIDAPPAAADADPTTGAWLALGAGLLMAAGSALSLAEARAIEEKWGAALK